MPSKVVVLGIGSRDCLDLVVEGFLVLLMVDALDVDLLVGFLVVLPVDFAVGVGILGMVPKAGLGICLFLGAHKSH